MSFVIKERVKAKVAERKTVRGKTEKKESVNDKRTDLPKTHTGRRLTLREARFIDAYLETGNGTEAVRRAGYKQEKPSYHAQKLLKRTHIAEEIRYRTQEMSKNTIASAQEVMEYFTKVMKGEIKDQFGLEAPLSERTKAAQELAKRTVDIENRLAGKEDAKVTIEIDWKRNKEDSE